MSAEEMKPNDDSVISSTADSRYSNTRLPFGSCRMKEGDREGECGEVARDR